MKNTLLILVIGLFTLSCKTSFRISVLEPAIAKIPENVQRYGVVNEVNSNNSPEKVVGAILMGEQINSNVVASERALDGVIRALDESGNLTGQILMNAADFRTGDGELNWAYIDTLAKQREIDGFIEFAEMRTTSLLSSAIQTTSTGSRFARIEGTLFVNVYVAHTHEKYERYWVRRFYNVPISGTMTLAGMVADAKRTRDYYRALGFDLGFGAGRLVYPNWVWVNRTYYNKGSANLKRAKPMIQQGNWDIAEKQLLRDLDSPSDKVRRRVLYNLALVKEGQGELSTAIDYAEKSALEGDKMANEYLRTLKRRRDQLSEF
jgi:hypothetical protein